MFNKQIKWRLDNLEGRVNSLDLRVDEFTAALRNLEEKAKHPTCYSIDDLIPSTTALGVLVQTSTQILDRLGLEVVRVEEGVRSDPASVFENKVTRWEVREINNATNKRNTTKKETGNKRKPTKKAR